MAEAIGIVSGAITLADATVKADKGILALKRLWNEVHEVPEYINSLLDRLALVHSVLSELETELNHNPQLKISNPIQLSIQHCKGAKDRLNVLGKKLSQGVGDKTRLTRNRARVKAVLGKEVARRLEDEIRDAMQLPGIAQHTYAIALARQQPALIMDQIMSGVTAQGQSAQICTPVPPAIAPNTAFNTQKTTKGAFQGRQALPWRYSIFGSYASRSFSNTSSEEVRSVRIQTPAWLARSVWDICARRACNGWRYTLQQWTVRPECSDIFRTVVAGNLSATTALFNERKASLYDRDPGGRTLLHHGVLNGHLEMISYLIRSGLSMHETNIARLTPIDYLYFFVDVMSESASTILSVYRLMESTDDLSDEISVLFRAAFSFTFWTHRLSLFVWRVPGLFDLVAAQFRLAPLEYRLQSIHWHLVDPEVLLDILERESKNPEDFARQLSRNGNDLLHHFARAYFDHAPRQPNRANLKDPQSDAVFEKWRRLARWIFKECRAKDVAQPGNEAWDLMTPLFADMANPYWEEPASAREVRQARQRLNNSLVYWLEDVQGGGVDLVSYGWWEWKRFNEGWGPRAPGWKKLVYGGEEPRLTSLEFGSSPQDWKLIWGRDWWEPYLVEDAGVFFEWAEKPPPLMPGSWLDDYDEP
ncbi:hypothetical protein BDV19DRAFT_390368 [Aspergillus venezuelensis]